MLVDSQTRLTTASTTTIEWSVSNAMHRATVTVGSARFLEAHRRQRTNNCNNLLTRNLTEPFSSLNWVLCGKYALCTRGLAATCDVWHLSTATRTLLLARRDDVTYADDVTSEQPLRSPQSALRLCSFFVLFYFIAPRQKLYLWSK